MRKELSINCSVCDKTFLWVQLYPSRIPPSTCGRRTCRGKYAIRRLDSEKLRNMSSRQMGEKNSNWKGDKVGYYGIHRWIEKRLERPDLCPECLKNKQLDLCNISGEYKRDISDWKWQCRRCHMSEDGRMRIFLLNSRPFAKKHTTKK